MAAISGSGGNNSKLQGEEATGGVGRKDKRFRGNGQDAGKRPTHCLGIYTLVPEAVCKITKLERGRPSRRQRCDSMSRRVRVGTTVPAVPRVALPSNGGCTESRAECSSFHGYGRLSPLASRLWPTAH